MLPLRTLIYKSRVIGLSGKVEEYRIATCIDLNVSVECPISEKGYQRVLTDRITGLVSSQLAECIRNYENPDALRLDLNAIAEMEGPLTIEKIMSAGTPCDPNKPNPHKAAIIYQPLEDYMDILNYALHGYTDIKTWPPKKITPPKNYNDAWFPFPVIMCFFELPNLCRDYTKESNHFFFITPNKPNNL